MIEPKDCYLTDTCPKYQNTNGQCVADNFCLKQFKIENLLSETLLTDLQKKRLSLRLDADRTDEDEFYRLQQISNNIEEWVKGGGNLYIYSATTGNGKTAWSIRLLQEYINKIWPYADMTCKALFINVPRYLLAIKDSISNYNAYAAHIKENVNNADLVIWDDIATKGVTEFESENLLAIIDNRMNEGKANIFTSNVGAEDMESLLGPRLTSRLKNFSEWIVFNGKDKRSVRVNI